MKTLGLFLLGCLCSISAYRLFDGWLAALWVPGAFIVPWLLRDEIAKRVHNPLPLALALGFLLLALFTTGCAAMKEPEVRDADLAPQKIKIQTYPAGGLIDLNGNILGTSPVEISVMPRNRALWWPSEVNPFQTFRARWPNGATAGEVFFTDGPMPKQVGLMADLSWFRGNTVAPLTLTQ